MPIKKPLIGPNWLHEVKHGGFRPMARRDAAGVRVITVQALLALSSPSPTS